MSIMKYTTFFKKAKNFTVKTQGNCQIPAHRDSPNDTCFRPSDAAALPVPATAKTDASRPFFQAICSMYGWLVVDLPSEKWWSERPLGLWNSQLDGKIKNCPNHQPDGISTYIWVIFGVNVAQIPYMEHLSKPWYRYIILDLRRRNPPKNKRHILEIPLKSGVFFVQ